MTTAGGLVFFGNDSEAFEAVDARDRKIAVALQHGPIDACVPDELCSKRQAVRCHRIRKRSVYVCSALKHEIRDGFSIIVHNDCARVSTIVLICLFSLDLLPCLARPRKPARFQSLAQILDSSC